MIALPSIAFDGFSGSAKDVTARNVNGRTILSVKAYSKQIASPAQIARRTSLSKVSRAYKNLTDSQMKAWESLAERMKSTSIFGHYADLTGHNAFVRLNTQLQMTGASILYDAPATLSSVPYVRYEDYWVMGDRIIFTGIEQPEDKYKLVLKMSAGQSTGVSSAWNKTVVISPSLVPDWGDVDVLELYTSVLGHSPIEGQKYFIEMYWMDSETGFTGESIRLVATCGPKSNVHEDDFRERNILTEDNMVYDETLTELSYDVEAISGSALLYVNIDFEISGYVMGVSGNLKKEQNVIPTGSYYTFGRGKGDRQFSISHMEVRVGSDSYQIAGREGSFDKKAEVFGVVCWARR